MPNDAKFGVALGLTLVIAVAVIFFRKDDTAAPTIPSQSVTPAVATTKAERTANTRTPVSAQPAILSREIDSHP